MNMAFEEFLVVSQYRVVEHYRRLLTGQLPDDERETLAHSLAREENELDRLRRERPN